MPATESATPRFFVPGEEAGAEALYEQLRNAAAAEAGSEPRQKRIFSLGCRVAGRDCSIEVGTPDPVEGRTVLAIFDLGGQDRYSIRTAYPGAGLRISRHVYWVTEFAEA
jgi:hypothetical protein